MLADIVRLRFLLALGSLLLCVSARAETAGLPSRSPSSGLDIPGTSVALEDGPASGVVNPAGLGMQRSIALRYLHEEGVGGDGFRGPDGDGLYFGLPLFGLLGFGVSFEWIDPEISRIGHHRRTTWSLAVGDEVLSIGASAHVFTHGLLDDHTTWDLGLLLRPTRFLSLGFVARDLDATRIDRARLNRRYVAALGLRPFGDWLTLSAEGEVLGSENDDVPHGFGSTALAYLARVRALPGLTIYGGYGHRLDGGTDLIQAGLRLDAGVLGLDGAPLIRTAGGSVGWVAGAELHGWTAPSSVGSSRSRMAYVRLDDQLAAPGRLPILPGARRDPMIDVVEGLSALARDDRFSGVVLEIRDSLPLGLGLAGDIRQAILELRASGKKVVVYLQGADDTVYFLASAADRVVASPGSAFFVNGFQSRADFFEETLSWIGVHIEVLRIGKYKSAPEALTRRTISDEQREVMESLLDDSFRTYTDAVASSRSLDPARTREVLNVGIRTAESAKEAGLVDDVAYPDELADLLRAWTGRPVHLVDHPLGPEEWEHWSSPPVIAVIPIEGTIVSGESGGFGFVQSTGARTVVRSIRRAASDPAVRSILLRIDSGGGDAGGSQLIWRAVSEARKKKPVIVSMGDAAASGGYYAAVGADRVFATPATITGSIGIFWLKPNLSGLVEKLKVGTFETSRGEQAGILSAREAWTDAEKRSIQSFLDAFYLQFIETTANERSLTVEAVDAVGQGRVWTGRQAWEHELVDDLGGLPAALRAAREEAGLPSDAVVRFRVESPSHSLFSSGGLSRIAGAAPDGPVASLLRATVPIPILLWNDTGLWALSPHAWRAR